MDTKSVIGYIIREGGYVLGKRGSTMPLTVYPLGVIGTDSTLLIAMDDVSGLVKQGILVEDPGHDDPTMIKYRTTEAAHDFIVGKGGFFSSGATFPAA